MNGEQIKSSFQQKLLKPHEPTVVKIETKEVKKLKRDLQRCGKLKRLTIKSDGKNFSPFDKQFNKIWGMYCSEGNIETYPIFLKNHNDAVHEVYEYLIKKAPGLKGCEQIEKNACDQVDPDDVNLGFDSGITPYSILCSTDSNGDRSWEWEKIKNARCSCAH